MRFRRRSNEALLVDIGDSELIRGLAARLLADPSNWKSASRAGRDNGLENPEIQEGLGLTEDDATSPRPPEQIEKLACQPLESAWQRDRVYRNACQFTDSLQLSDLEARVLALVYHIEYDNLLAEAAEAIEKCTRQRLARIFGQFLDASTAEAAKTISSDSPLFQFGLIEGCSFTKKPNLDDAFSVEDPVAAALAQRAPTPERLMAPFYRPAPGASLNRDDFAHIAYDLDAILAIIAKSAEDGAKGVNILIHGPPGTGKTELAQIIGSELKANTAFVPETDEEGDSLGPKQRFRVLAACDQILSNTSSSLLIMDECEDMVCNMGTAMSLFNTGDNLPKASITYALEANFTPSIWISNTTESVDPAYLRRFSYVLELDTPGPVQRENVLQRILHDYPVSEETVSRMAEHETVSPALAATAARAGMQARGENRSFEDVFVRTLDNHLEAMGANRLPQPGKGDGLSWRRECLNAEQDMGSLLDELDPDTGARLLLYGPPGTGKTAWGRQLAEQLKRPLLVKRASDLVDPYVGMTEKKIARAFRQAEADNAILLIDEADSFLDDRSQARQSWQISHVNQFLASMEEFDGFLVCTTNFDARMDIASMRRFDFRVGFDYLTIQQAAVLFTDLCELAGIPSPEEATLMEWLAGMTKLTPGDFHVLARQVRIRRHARSAEQLLRDLRKECAYKESAERPIGFLADIQ